MRPRIAIPLPTSTDLAYNERSWTAYADAVTRAGGEPVAVALGLSAADTAALAAGCDGVCLPGSPADVEPGRYGVERDPATSPMDGAREATDDLLLEDAWKHGKPVLGICYGVQSLNVWRGGTLVQDLMPLPVNHSAGKAVAVAHTALVAEHSLLGQMLLSEEDTRTEAPLVDGYLRLPVNTSHHQAISEPGDGLRIAARCPDDGVVEAVEIDTNEDPKAPTFVVGVQWHPERSYDISAASRALFARLIEEAADRKR